MKGKKKNYKFVSDFIVKCSKEGKNTTDDIINKAQVRMLEIDDILKKISELKVERSNLLDVMFVLKDE